MTSKIEVRQLPKKTSIYIGILIIAGIIGMFIVKDGKAQKATKILHQLGFLSVSDVTVFSKTEFLREDTNVKGYQYALKFTDLTTNKQCRGFILRDFKGKVDKDLECK